MATRNEYAESLKGMGRIPPAQGVYEESAIAKTTLGYRIEFADGRVFRYAKAGATALSPGKFVKAGAIEHVINYAVEAAATTGAHIVTLTTTSACTTVEEGYLQINDAAGEGIQYKIKFTRANATTSTSTDVTLYDPIATALTVSSEGTILYNPYEQCEIVSAITDIVLGVPPIAVTAEYYFWLQTWGPANVLSAVTPTAGNVVEVSVATDDAAAAGTTDCLADTSHVVGVQMLIGVDTEYKPVWIRLAP